MKEQSTKRSESITDKAVNNAALNLELAKCYNTLWNDLVKTSKDADIFQDTYLKLTQTFDPARPFSDQFRDTYKQLRRCYNRCDRADIKTEYNDNIKLYGIYTEKEN